MGSVRKLAGDTVIYGMSSIVGRFLNWWLVPYHCRIFLPEEYGVVTNMYSYVAILLVILTYGMETGFFRFAGKGSDKEKVYSTSLVSLLITSLSFVLLIFAFSDEVASFIDYEKHPEYIKWMAIIVAIDAFTAIPFAGLRLKNKAIKFAVFKFLNIGINIAANLFFLSLCPWLLKNNPDSIVRYIYSPEVGVGYVFISNFIASVVLIIVLLPETLRVKFNFDWCLLKEILVYSFPILIVGITGMVSQNVDKILLPKLIPADQNPMEQLGIYGANFKLAVLMNMFIQAFRYAFEPFFFAREKNHESNQIYALVMKYFVIFGLFIFLGMVLFIDIIKLLIDPAYHNGLKAVPIVTMANLFIGIYFTLSLWYKLTDKTIYGAYVATIGMVLTLILNFLLIPVYGYMGSAIALLVCFVILTVISYLLSRKYFPVNYDLRRMFLYFAVVMVLYLLSLKVHFDSTFLKLLFASALFVIFGIFVVVKEKKEVFSMLKKQS